VFTDVRIETRRLLLRLFTHRDLEAFRRIASQEPVLRYLPDSDRMTPEEMEVILNWLIDCYSQNSPESIKKLTLPIVLKRSGEIVGWCGIGPLEFDESEYEIYFLIAHEHWGDGLATEASRALLEYAFGDLGLQRIVAVVDQENRASVRVLEKLGMQPQGPVRGLAPDHSHYEGHMLYALSAGECNDTDD
jgi:ribosomal-protein-alanine N-acetyltransferase